MANQYLRQSPLAGLRLAARAADHRGTAGVWMCERRFLGMLDLRGPEDAGFAAAVQSVLGLAPPREPNRAVEQAARRILWLGPDEWLIVLPSDDTPVLQRRLLERLAGQFAAVTEVGEGRAVIGLGGSLARDLLSHGTALDLHPRVFGPGQCAQTRFAHMPLLIHQRDDSPAYDLYVQRSLAEYLWDWLEAAAGDYSLAILEEQAG